MDEDRHAAPAGAHGIYSRARARNHHAYRFVASATWRDKDRTPRRVDRAALTGQFVFSTSTGSRVTLAAVLARDPLHVGAAIVIAETGENKQQVGEAIQEDRNLRIERLR